MTLTSLADKDDFLYYEVCKT